MANGEPRNSNLALVSPNTGKTGTQAYWLRKGRVSQLPANPADASPHGTLAHPHHRGNFRGGNLAAEVVFRDAQVFVCGREQQTA